MLAIDSPKEARVESLYYATEILGEQFSCLLYISTMFCKSRAHYFQTFQSSNDYVPSYMDVIPFFCCILLR